MVPLQARLDIMTDKQLTKVLVHHNYVFKTPADWMQLHMQDGKEGCLMVKKYCPQKVQFSISEPPLTKAQLGRGMLDDYVWYIRKLLDVIFGEPKTLEDISLTMSMVETVNQTLLNLWCRAPTLPWIPVETGEDSETGEHDTAQQDGPFQDQRRNEIWR
eukprot:128101-Rhodomonas_salina.1